MAGPLTVLGAVAGSTQLASQIISTIKTIISVYQQVNNASNHIFALLDHIDSTPKMLERLTEGTDGDEVILRSLGIAKGALVELQDMLESLNTEVRKKGWKWKMRSGPVKGVVKEQMIGELVGSLERAKSSLNGALLHQIMSV
jgi:hypothetical protein